MTTASSAIVQRIVPILTVIFFFLKAFVLNNGGIKAAPDAVYSSTRSRSAVKSPRSVTTAVRSSAKASNSTTAALWAAQHTVPTFLTEFDNEFVHFFKVRYTHFLCLWAVDLKLGVFIVRRICWPSVGCFSILL